MPIEIPKRLETHLAKDNAWYNCVTILKAQVEQFLSGSPEFFPDYTFHGIAHINAVLQAADKLILREAFTPSDYTEKEADSGLLAPMDVAYLVCAILLHDLGMFLHRDGVRKVASSSRRITGFGDKPWKTVWQDYTERTKRFSSERMHYQFGKLMTVSTSILDKEPLNDDDKRIIGEFLRQNHGRLAHEIAVYGLPGSSNIDLFAQTSLTDEERNLIGLLARSHTMDIRDTEDFLKAKFEEGPMPENTPVFFLMAVLRIADYLDAGDHRAPQILEDNQKIYVPVSEAEWSWNQRINLQKCRWNLTKKNRYIYATPKSSIEYVRLDKWMRGVQRELDLSWSILAEQYPNGYRLSIHRLTSRIYQKEYRKEMNEHFLPEEVKVTASPEITRLMIEPLYGSEPTYGIRELLQNAVDACLERKDHEYQKGTPSHYKGKVNIYIDPWIDPTTGESLGVFTIEDNGIGMDAHVLMNYYLSAGASYRSSEEWKRNYTEDGHARIARTGRFGVGFLAAFLLGNSVSVTTQHINDEKGYTFEFSNIAKPLNITRTKRALGPGTTIRIVMKSGVIDRLKDEHQDSPWYGWYAFDDPEIRYIQDGTPMNQKTVFLSRAPAANPAWLPLKSKIFESYLWHPGTGSDPCSKASPVFLCNGIPIRNTRSHSTLQNIGLSIPFPHVSVIDPDARLEINLARSEILRFPAKDTLIDQVLRYHIARLLMTPWETENDYQDNLTRGFCLRSVGQHGRIPFLLSSAGFTLNYASFLRVMEITQLALLYYEGEDASSAVDVVNTQFPEYMPFSIAVGSEAQPDPNLLMSNQYYFRSPSDFANTILSAWKGLWDEMAINVDLDRYPGAVAIRDDVYFALRNNIMTDPLPAYCSHQENTYRFDRYGGIPQEMTCVIDNLDPALFPFSMQLIFVEYDYRLRDYGDPNLPFPRLLQELLGPNADHPNRDMWIPFDMEERKKKFPEAFEELEPFFDYIRCNPTP